MGMIVAGDLGLASSLELLSWIHKSGMLRCESTSGRQLRSETIQTDLVVVGGGMAGVCAAITAARAGIQVTLVQDRPVLGGNASSEVRLWILGATSHGGNNNRWAREGGVIDEILVENCYRNPEGNPVILDTVLLEKVLLEPGIRLLLNTAVHDLRTRPDGSIDGVRAFCSQSSTTYDLQAPLFCDASGDGIIAFLAGAAFRSGAESTAEFGELLGPPEPSRSLLGHSIFFYTRDTQQPVLFTKPAYALDDITKIPRYRRFNTKEIGSELWWIEYGGTLDTVHDCEQIKWELWKIIYGVWDYIKNSGRFPDARNKTLEWVGTIPGKRESRRFEGDHMLVQQDIVEQRTHYDAVSYGGWAIDLHPPEGIYSPEAPCTQWHSKGVYQIPYRCLYSRTIPNLFLAGRIISASHIAFGSSRVMATCAHNGQAVGMAAAICRRRKWSPRQLADKDRIRELQSELIRSGQWIPGIVLKDSADLAQNAAISGSSRLRLGELPPSGRYEPLDEHRAIILPARGGKVPRFTFYVKSGSPAQLEFQLRKSSRPGSFTPDEVLESKWVSVSPSQHDPSSQGTPDRGNGSGAASKERTAGTRHQPSSSAIAQSDHASAQTFKALVQEVVVEFSTVLEEAGYVFCCLMANPQFAIATSDHQVTGLTSVANRQESRVSQGTKQMAPIGTGVETFEFWTPRRRPEGRHPAFRCEPPLDAFSPRNVCNGVTRPWRQTNAWVADLRDKHPKLQLNWNTTQVIQRIELSFDTDFDHPLESVLMQHPENVMPCCVRQFSILGQNDTLIYRCTDNHQTRRAIELPEPITTDRLTIELAHPSGVIPASLFEIRCYGPADQDSHPVDSAPEVPGEGLKR
jgi:hypothetical protein